jgi:hypothetical protein
MKYSRIWRRVFAAVSIGQLPLLYFLERGQSDRKQHLLPLSSFSFPGVGDAVLLGSRSGGCHVNTSFPLVAVSTEPVPRHEVLSPRRSSYGVRRYKKLSRRNNRPPRNWDLHQDADVFSSGQIFPFHHFVVSSPAIGEPVGKIVEARLPSRRPPLRALRARGNRKRLHIAQYRSQNALLYLNRVNPEASPDAISASQRSVDPISRAFWITSALPHPSRMFLSPNFLLRRCVVGSVQGSYGLRISDPQASREYW